MEIVQWCDSNCGRLFGSFVGFYLLLDLHLHLYLHPLQLRMWRHSLRQPPDAADHRQSDHHPQLRRVGSVLKLNGCCRLMKCSRWNISLLWAEHENEYIEMKERPAGFGCANSLFCACGKSHRSSNSSWCRTILLTDISVVSCRRSSSWVSQLCRSMYRILHLYICVQDVCPTLTCHRTISCLLHTELQFCTLNRNTTITQTW